MKPKLKIEDLFYLSYRRTWNSLHLLSEFVSGTVLDIGSGRGHNLVRISELGSSHVVGSDIVVDKNLGMNLEKPGISFVQSDCTSLPLQDSCIDLVFAHHVLEHIDMLEELIEDLAALVDRLEFMWGSVRSPHFMKAIEDQIDRSAGIITEKLQSAYTVRPKDGRRIEFQFKRDEQECKLQVTANGKPVELSRRQSKLIRRHQERICALLLEAVDQKTKDTEPKNRQR